MIQGGTPLRAILVAGAFALSAAHVPSLGVSRAHRFSAPRVHRQLRRQVAPLRILASSNAQPEFDAVADAELVRRLEAEVQALTGSGLDGLLSPMKLVNTERDLVKLRVDLEALDPTSTEAVSLREKIATKEEACFYEKRSVMKGWLRTVFRAQSYISIVVSALVSYDALPGVGHLDIAVRVLGFWSWWLFTIPSLRSIKPLVPQEKAALNAAFLAVLGVSLVAPVLTKDPALIWWLDAGAVGLCYAFFFTVGADAAAGATTADGADEREKSGVEKALKFALRAIDFGSGIERGQRSAEATALEQQLQQQISARAKAGVRDDKSNSK